MSQRSSRVVCLFLSVVVVAGAAGAVSSRDLTSSALAFVYGLKAYNHGDYELARQKLEEALALRPGDGEARLVLGLTLHALSLPEEAAAQLEQSLKAKRTLQTDPAVVRGYLAEARQRGPAAALSAERIELPGWNRLVRTAGVPRVHTRVTASIASVSNPVAIDELVGFQGVAGLEGSQAVGDLEVLAELYPFFDRRGRTLELSLAGRQSFYPDTPELDLGLAQGLFQLAWGGDPHGYLNGPLASIRTPVVTRRHSFLLQAGALYGVRDGERALHALRGAGAWICRPGRRHAVQFDLAVEERELDLGILGERGGTEVRVRISPSHYFPGRTRYFRWGVLAGRRTAGKGFASTFAGLSTEASWTLSRKSSLYLGADLRHDEWDRPASSLRDSRSTLSWNAAAGFVRSLHRHLLLTARLSYGARDSAAFDYRRLGLGLTWLY